MKIIIAIIIVLLIAGAVTAGILLYPYNPDKPPKADDSQATEEGVQEVVDANNQFALDLYSNLDSNENVFFSPYSISAALAMTYEGAKGDTKDEMRDVFYFPESNILRPNFAAIYNGINEGNKAYKLSTGNALWVQENAPLNEDYITLIEKYYGGKAANLDFFNEPKESVETINSFIEKQTNNKIKDLLSEGDINAMTRLILTNAIYFKGTWEWEFKKSSTHKVGFNINSEEVVQVDMMHMKNDKASFNYLDTGSLQVLELPYKGEDVSMLILLPEDINSLELTTENLEKWKSEMKEGDLDAIYFPKFEFETKYRLNDYLKAMGMPSAFTEEADFSGMTDLERLYIGFVIHQAYVKVDEKGTEAAAATAVGMMATSAEPRSIFRADRPFVFIIQEKQTGNILFLGKVMDPR